VSSEVFDRLREDVREIKKRDGQALMMGDLSTATATVVEHRRFADFDSVLQMPCFELDDLPNRNKISAR